MVIFTLICGVLMACRPTYSSSSATCEAWCPSWFSKVPFTLADGRRTQTACRRQWLFETPNIWPRVDRYRIWVGASGRSKSRGRGAALRSLSLPLSHLRPPTLYPVDARRELYLARSGLTDCGSWYRACRALYSPYPRPTGRMKANMSVLHARRFHHIRTL